MFSKALQFGTRNSIGSLIAAIIFLTISAHGAVIYQTGFENPPFTTGNIAGQDGWSVFNPGSTFDQIETAKVRTGAQAAWVGPIGTLQSGIFHSDSTTGPLIDLSADIYLFSSSTQSGWQFAGLGSGLAPFIGGIDISSTGAISLITSGFTSAGTFTRNVWHNVDFLFNMTTQKYSFSLDGALIASGVAFCGDNGPCAGGPVVSYGSSFFDVFATLNSNDSGALDNFSLAIAPVPEPGSLLLMASGLILVGIRRRFASQKA